MSYSEAAVAVAAAVGAAWATHKDLIPGGFVCLLACAVPATTNGTRHPRPLLPFSLEGKKEEGCC